MRGRACVELGRATLGARPEEVAGSRDRDRFTDAGLYPITIAPDGSEVVPATKPQPDGALLKALARAWRWQRMLDDGVYASVSEIGDAENISKSYVSRILRLALLAPDIVDGILAGRTDQVLTLEKLERPLPASCEEQWRVLEALRRRGLLIERIDIAPDGISVTLHAAGIRTLVAELADQEAPALVAYEPLLEATE
jgi:hypothetical protein